MRKVRMYCLAASLVVLGHSVSAAELDAFASDGEKAVHCYQAQVLNMQYGAATMTSPGQASEIIKKAERWQSVIQHTLPDVRTQRSALQESINALTARIRPLGRDPNAILNQVIKPLVAECDALLTELDTPVPSAATKPQAPAKPVAPAIGPFESDVFSGLVHEPRYANFRWNPHSDIYAKVKGRGLLRRTDTGFRVEFETKITTLCVGDLIESRRSEDGYLMHLIVEGSDEGCQPRVTHGLLFPMSFDDQPKNRRLMLRLMDDQDRLITSMTFESDALESRRLDPEKLVSMRNVVLRMQENSDEQRRNAKLVNLQNRADFSRLEPFYNSCTNAAPSSGQQTTNYCICMTYKFGVGERIPESEYQSYIGDFSRLTNRFQTFTDENRLYTRLAEECRSCSNPEFTLRAGCDTPDTAMYLPTTFAGVIDQMEKEALRLESSEFYKENFFVIYLQGYSDFCSPRIADPVPFDYVVTETTIDPYGGTYTNETQRDRTYIARRHADRYEAIYGKHAKMTPEEFFGAFEKFAIRDEADLRRTTSDLSTRVRIETEKRVAVREHLSQGCSSQPVQRVYSRLSSLFE